MKAELQKIIDQTMITIHNLNDTKGMEYADEGDALANFKNRAAQLDLDPLKVWGIFFGKHADAIYSYVRNGKVYSEAIEGRIDDAILYLILLKGLIQEKSAEARWPRCQCGQYELVSPSEAYTRNGWYHNLSDCGPLGAKPKGNSPCQCGDAGIPEGKIYIDVDGWRHRRQGEPFPCMESPTVKKPAPTPPQKCYCTAVTLNGSEASREYANWLHKRDTCLFLEEDASA